MFTVQKTYLPDLSRIINDALLNSRAGIAAAGNDAVFE